MASEERASLEEPAATASLAGGLAADNEGPLAELRGEVRAALRASEAARASLARLERHRGPSNLYLGNNRLSCWAPRLELYLVLESRDQGASPHICAGREWEAGITRFLEGAVRPGDSCVDVGADFGWFSALMARRTGPKGRVLSIEPNPKSFSNARFTMDVNGLLGTGSGVSVLNAAVLDREGEVEVTHMPERSGANHVLGEDMLPEPLTRDAYMVPSVSLDGALREWDALNVLKVDAQGAEHRVWRGMQKTVRRFPNALYVFELSPPTLARHERAAIARRRTKAGAAETAGAAGKLSSKEEGTSRAEDLVSAIFDTFKHVRRVDAGGGMLHAIDVAEALAMADVALLATNDTARLRELELTAGKSEGAAVQGRSGGASGGLGAALQRRTTPQVHSPA